MKPLAPGYSVQVDALQTSEWTQITNEFADNNIYQAWAYETARDVRTSHLVLGTGARSSRRHRRGSHSSGPPRSASRTSGGVPCGVECQ